MKLLHLLDPEEARLFASGEEEVNEMLKDLESPILPMI